MTTSKPRRAGLYARCSTLDQSPQMQIDALRDYAAQRGLEIVEEYVDHGVSGTKSKRPALDRLMDAARKRKLDAVLVYRFDRFARSQRHLVVALEEFQGLGVQFVSYAENLDTNSPIGKAMFAIIAALAELERNIIVERSMEGQRRARARGKRIGRPQLDVDGDRIRLLRRDGASIRSIARDLGVSRSVVERILAA